MFSFRSKVVVPSLAALCLGLASCVDSSAPTGIKVPEKEVLQQLVVSDQVLIMTIKDTVKISVTAFNVLGDTIPLQNGVLTWKSSELALATVDSLGRIIAEKPTTSKDFVSITASFSYNGVTRTQEVVVNITETRLPIAGLKVVSRDSTRSSMTETLAPPMNWATAIAVDANRDSVAAPVLRLTPSIGENGTVTVANLGEIGQMLFGAPYLILSRHIGPYWIRTQATVYGTPMSDSLQYTGLYPAEISVRIARDSTTNLFVSPVAGQELYAQPCASVNFVNDSQSPIDIVFDDSTKTGQCVPWDETGNVVGLGAGQTGIRKFPAVGTVVWTVRNPANGQRIPTASGKVSLKVP